MMIKIACLAALLVLAVAQHGYEHKHEHAHSSQHISKHDGHAQEVTIKDEHGHVKHVDYYTHPKYEFEYKVWHEHRGYDNWQRERRVGDVTDNDAKHSVHHIVPHHH